MTGQWEFNKRQPSDVEQDLTQRDQFNNDDVGIADALVREFIQNSTDVPSGDEPVIVRFSFCSWSQASGPDGRPLSEHFSQLLPHLTACGVPQDVIQTDPVRVLAIEDFNTKGLTGAIDKLDEGHFRNFWRRHGRSSKGGASGGRWGLGKLVYSSSSRIRVFYGLTVREGESGSLLMGQSVLNGHEIGDARYHPHGFWFSHRSSDRNKLQLPVSDSGYIREFSRRSGVRRTNESGLSIVIPFLADAVDEAAITAAVISNYYFPILSDRLVVEVGDQSINKTTLAEIAKTLSAKKAISLPMEFVSTVGDLHTEQPDATGILPIGRNEFSESFLEESDVALLREKYATGKPVKVQLPVELKRKNGEELRSTIDLYLQGLPDDKAASFALFARGAIVLPAERKFFARSPAYGATVATDSALSEFLGDAENPAHTGWNPNAEKLSTRWRNRQKTLASVRHALKKLYELIDQQEIVDDPDALIDFFALIDSGSQGKGKKKGEGPRSPEPKPQVTPRNRDFNINEIEGGFVLVSDTGSQDWDYPQSILVSAAFDIHGADPFRRHSKYDFDFTKMSGLSFEERNASVEPVGENTIRVNVVQSDFSVRVSGFDTNRDLVVRARLEK